MRGGLQWRPWLEFAGPALVSNAAATKCNGIVEPTLRGAVGHMRDLTISLCEKANSTGRRLRLTSARSVSKVVPR